MAVPDRPAFRSQIGAGRGVGGDVDAGHTRLYWTAAGEISGLVTRLGTRLMEGALRALTEEFWADFARRVETA